MENQDSKIIELEQTIVTQNGTISNLKIMLKMKDEEIKRLEEQLKGVNND